MIIFEKTGADITGGRDDAHNQSFVERVDVLEGFIYAIGKTLGMATIESAFVTMDDGGYGFRFASTSEDKFDVRGIEMNECDRTSDLIEKLG